MLTWKIVGDPKASVIYIYIYYAWLYSWHEWIRKKMKQPKIQLLFLMRAWREQQMIFVVSHQIHILLLYLSNKLKIWRICSWYIEDSFFIIVLFCFVLFLFLFFFFFFFFLNNNKNNLEWNAWMLCNAMQILEKQRKNKDNKEEWSQGVEQKSTRTMSERLN